MNRLNRVFGRFFGIAAALLIGIFFVQVTADADIGPDPKTNARHSRIVGLWDVEATITNCATGGTLTSFLALHKFEFGGTGQVVPATNPASLSAPMMIWSHVKKNDYLMSAKLFRFDGAGTYIGWVVLTNEVSINEAADEYVQLWRPMQRSKNSCVCCTQTIEALQKPASTIIVDVGCLSGCRQPVTILLSFNIVEIEQRKTV
ncbi:MAG: hypothetical protein SH820_12955 [Xanthomonadales bacterium]|nr:hypothetical protein [Xanthomonadales bacterium]